MALRLVMDIVVNVAHAMAVSAELTGVEITRKSKSECLKCELAFCVNAWG